MMIASTQMDKYYILTCLLLTLTQLLQQVAADYEHMCASDDYRGRRHMLSNCGRRLTEQVFTMCSDRPNVGRKKRSASIFMGKEEANIILRNKREMEEGIVCECCINRCNSRELQQYCASTSRRRRSLKSIVAGVSQPPTIFTEEIVDKIYEEIAEDKYTETDSQQQVAVKLQIIEENKRENIIISFTDKEEPTTRTQQQKIPYNSERLSFASGHDSDSSRDTGKLISKSLIANKRIHRHHKKTQRKHHKSLPKH